MTPPRPALAAVLATLTGDDSRTFRDALHGEFILRDDGVYLPRDNRTRAWLRTPATRTPVGTRSSPCAPTPGWRATW